MHLLPPLVAAAWLAGLTAQSPSSTSGSAAPSGRLASPNVAAEQGVVTDTAVDGTLWAAGPTWKASFAADGTTFVPCFGPAAPRNFPAAMPRAVVSVAGQLLAGEPVPPTFAFAAVEYRGPSFTERYELRSAGIEQQFVFTTLPARGALQVMVPFSSELACRGAGADGFRFANEHGSFGYGRAVAFDADGDRLELTTEWTGSGFVITVPAAFVAEASLPLVVDPLVGNVVAYTTDTKTLVSTDAAWDESLGRFAVVHERVFSATDSDVYVRYHDGGMQFATPTYAIDLSADSWRAPRIAGLEAHDTFLVVAEKSTGNVAPWRGFGRTVTGAVATLGTPFQVFNLANDVTRLDVGGDPAPVGPTQFCVVAEYAFSAQDHDIYGVAVSASGVPATPFAVDAAGGMQTRPQISASCGEPGGGSEAWGVAYYLEPSAIAVQARFAALSRTFAVLGRAIMPLTHPSAGSTVAISSPTDHGQGRMFAMTTAYEISGHYEARTVAWTTTGSLQADTGIWVGGSLLNGEARLDCDGTRFVLALATRAPGVRTDVSFTLLGLHGNYLAAENWDYGGSLADSAPAVVAKHSGGGNRRTYGVAWVETTGPTAHRIECSLYDGIQDGVQFATRPTGCGGLVMNHTGESTLGGTFQATLQVASGLAGFVVGFPVDQPVGPCAGCRQGVDGNVMLGSVYTFAVPRNAAFVGLVLSLQGFQFGPPASGACLGQVNLSDTLDATLR